MDGDQRDLHRSSDDRRVHRLPFKPLRQCGHDRAEVHVSGDRTAGVPTRRVWQFNQSTHATGVIVGLLGTESLIWRTKGTLSTLGKSRAASDSPVLRVMVAFTIFYRHDTDLMRFMVHQAPVSYASVLRG